MTVYLRNGGPHGAVISRGIACRTDGPACGTTMSQETIREVDLLAARLGQRRRALVRHHADDLHPFRLSGADADEDALRGRPSLGEGLGREKRVDDDDAPLARVV